MENGDVSVKDLNPNPRNPRKIKDEKLKQLLKSMKEFGSLDGFIYNLTTKQLAGGHQRQKVMPEDAKVVIEKRYSTPTKQGTVSVGYVDYLGERWPYREVQWDENKEKAANIAANKGAGEWDLPKLQEWIIDLDTANFDLSLTMYDEEELKNLFGKEEDPSENPYTKKIEAPIYEPKGETPEIEELIDNKKTKELVIRIEKSNLTEKEKKFLKLAAQRHLVFNYSKVAEYYASASKEAQELMEESALVIIDFKKAIEGGFAILTEEIAEAYLNEHG